MRGCEMGRAMRSNISAQTDTQRQVAATRRLLRAAGLQR
jgi:hypothetical protein